MLLLIKIGVYIMIKKAFIRIPVVYSAYDFADIDIQTIQNVVRIRNHESEQGSCFVRTQNGNYDTQLTKETIAHAVSMAVRTLNNSTEFQVSIFDAKTMTLVDTEKELEESESKK